MNSTDFSNCPLVWVKWVDCHGRDGWRDVAGMLDWGKSAKLVCESCGWLIFEGKDRIVIASHRDVECAKVDSVWVIPKFAILEWRDIKDS